jgi:hypothetical protein
LIRHGRFRQTAEERRNARTAKAAEQFIANVFSPAMNSSSRKQSQLRQYKEAHAKKMIAAEVLDSCVTQVLNQTAAFASSLSSSDFSPSFTELRFNELGEIVNGLPQFEQARIQLRF